MTADAFADLPQDPASLAAVVPWDVWGAMTQKDAELDRALIDRLAELTVEPDRHFGELRAIYQDPRVKVPATVYNAVRNCPEAL